MSNQQNFTILLYSQQNSSRLEYIADVIFHVILGQHYQLTTDLRAYLSSCLPKINYSSKRSSSNEVWIPPSAFLYEQRLSQEKPSIVFQNGLPTAFLTQAEADFNHDVLAFSFYLISRYEEYQATPDAFDLHGRFRAAHSLAGSNNFLHIPVVDALARRLDEKLKERFHHYTSKLRSFEFVPTYDIDLAWAYKNRNFFRQVMGLSKEIVRLDSSGVSNRLKVWRGKRRDDFDVYDYLKEKHYNLGFLAKYFFLLGDLSKYDRSIDFRNKSLVSLIRSLDGGKNIGIHPSYRSNSNFDILQGEIQRLEKIIERPVTMSRQHFLKLKLPDTYRQLIQAGISHDYTMGYAEQIGFRASISRPFPWYDLASEQVTSLMIHPFQIMDGTLKNYLRLSTDAALEKSEKLLRTTAMYNGQFTLLWHNSSFSTIGGWKGWKAVYEGILQLATELTDVIDTD